MKKPVNDYKEARAEIIGIINCFPIGKENDLLFDKWSLKNIVSHLSGWATHQIRALKDVKAGVASNAPADMKFKINNKYVAARAKKAWPAAYREFQLLSGKLLKDYQILPDKLWKNPVWNDDPTTPLDLIKIETNHYHRTHGPEIKRIIDNQADKIRLKIVKGKTGQIKKFQENEWPIANREHFGRDVDYTDRICRIVAVKNNKITGVLKLITKGGVAYVDMLLVSNRLKRRGIGRQLIACAEEIAKKNKCHKVTLETGRNWESVKFYRAMGFKITNILKDHHFRQDYVIFTKAIMNNEPQNK